MVMPRGDGMSGLGLVILCSFACGFVETALPAFHETSKLSAEAVIESVLEADELPDEGIVAAVGLVSLVGQEAIEIEFRVDIMLRRGLHESCPCQAAARHAHEARGDGVPVLTIVAQAVLDEVRSGQTVDDFFRA